MQPDATTPRGGLARPITAGVVTALVGFTSAFTVVLAGLEGVGATAEQAASGLLAVSVLMGLGTILMSSWTRMPVTIVWSTPGAALLAATGIVEGGWPAAVGAFLLTGALIALTGFIPALGRLIAAIPTTIAQAMLAGVLFPLCLGPVLGLADNPLAVAPVVVTWLVAVRLVPRWAVPLAFLVAAIVIVVDLAVRGTAVDAARFAPVLELTAPAFTPAAAIGLAVPLWLVTMASQNVPGVAVLRNYGYEPPWRATMLLTGAGTMLGAAAGAHALNLAAISAALAAGDEAGPDLRRRWIAGLTSGIVTVVFGVSAAAFAALVGLAPAGIIAAVAGLALLTTFGTAVQQALVEPEDRLPAVAAFLVAASGIAVLGVSAAFWSLVAGLAIRGLLRLGRRHR